MLWELKPHPRASCGCSVHFALTVFYAGLLQVLPDVWVRFALPLSCAVICEPEFLHRTRAFFWGSG